MSGAFFMSQQNLTAFHYSTWVHQIISSLDGIGGTEKLFSHQIKTITQFHVRTMF